MERNGKERTGTRKYSLTVFYSKGEKMSQGPRHVRFGDFIDYIQKNYRMHLNSRDYEMLETIANNYNSEEIMKAIEYSKSRGSDSLKYLQDALREKYYQSQKVEEKGPEWLEKEVKKEPLDEEEKEWARNFYKKYCDTEEEYKEKIKELEE